MCQWPEVVEVAGICKGTFVSLFQVPSAPIQCAGRAFITDGYIWRGLAYVEDTYVEDTSIGV